MSTKTEREKAEWVTNEVLVPEVKEALDAYVRTVIREGQKTHEILSKNLRWAEQHVQGGEDIPRKAVIAAVFQHISTCFGDDALSKLLAEALATGDYLF